MSNPCMQVLILTLQSFTATSRKACACSLVQLQSRGSGSSPKFLWFQELFPKIPLAVSG